MGCEDFGWVLRRREPGAQRVLQVTLTGPTPHSRRLDEIQDHLARLYRLDIGARVSDFLLTRSEAEQWVSAGELRAEHVFVRHDEDGCALGLFLEDAVLSGLERRAALGWHEGSALQAYCHAAEGVSHFVMLVWSVDQDRVVRAVDLELQAEIDKALTCLLMDDLYLDTPRSLRLLERLFVESRLLPGLDDGEAERYRTANDLAHRYLRGLVPRLQQGVHRVLAEVREWYRLPPRDKVLRLAAA